MISIEQWTSLDAHGFALFRILMAVLWQSSILFLAIAAVTWMLRKRRASARHAVWLAALILAPLLPLLTSFATWSGAPQAPVNVMPAYEAPIRSVPQAEIDTPMPPVAVDPAEAPET